MKNVIAVLVCLLVSIGSTNAQEISHPLDPLTWQEHWSVLEILREAGHLDQDTGFSMVNLKEPSKDFVNSWERGQDIPRAAYAVVHQDSLAFNAEIDLDSKTLTLWDQLVDDQPTFLGREFGSMTSEILKDSLVLDALKKRGIEDLTFVSCFGGPPGTFGLESEKGRRLGRYSCTLNGGVRNSWTRSIGGLTIVADIGAREILEVIDEGVVPMAEVTADYDAVSLGPARKVPGPMHITQPMGPGFDIDGHQLWWQKWNFHIRPDHRVGAILSTVSYKDGDSKRSVLYQAHLSEIFVPYMDPSADWYARNFIDAGEYTQGGLSKPLMPGVDCPDHAVYFDAIISGDNGRPAEVPRMICVFEREPGDPSWRHHTGAGAGGPEGRASRELVVRNAAVLGNYDYIFDWIFLQNGSIQMRAGASGIAEVKTVAEMSTNEGATDENAPDAYGRFVDPQIVAVNHDHYFSFRLDLDVDGTSNSLQIDRLKTKILPEDHPRRSVWVSEPEIAQREDDAKLKIDYDRPSYWRVVSHSRENHVGYPTSYQLAPGKNGNTLLSPDDYPRRRVGFLENHLWVTPYNPSERYSAGDFPTLSTEGKGLPSWTSANRSIAETDIVLWYSMAMHHMVRGEDWPVMPVLWHQFELRPFDFFDHNPALDLPK